MEGIGGPLLKGPRENTVIVVAIYLSITFKEVRMAVPKVGY